MHWTIEHLAVPYSETDVNDWAVELHMVMPDHEWRVVERLLFDTAATFTLSPAQAGQVGELLEDAACSVLMHPSMVRMTEDIAAAAKKAAAARKPWRWT